MFIAICNRGSGALSASAPAGIDPGPGPEPEVPGDNKLLNSRLAVSETASPMAENWAARFPGEGTIAWASADDGHRQVRLTTTSTSDRGMLEQLYMLEAGEWYVYSIDIVTVHSAGDPERVVINHSPFGLGAPLGGPAARPTIGGVSDGQRVHYIFQATSSTQVKILIGCDGPGDVTVRRPMLQRSDELGSYTPTDPVAPEDPPEPGEAGSPLLPFRGTAVGNFTCAEQLQVAAPGRYTGDMVGYLVQASYTGTLKWATTNITTRKNGEETKSAKLTGGSTNLAQARAHSAGVDWWLAWNVYRVAGPTTMQVGTRIKRHEFVYKCITLNPAIQSRNAVPIPLDGIQVTAGEILFIGLENRENERGLNKLVNFPVLNSFGLWTGMRPVGQNRVNPYDGDFPVMATMTGTQLSYFTLGSLRCQGSCQLVYESCVVDGATYYDVIDGHYMRDSGGSSHVCFIGGGGQVKTTLRSVIDMSVDRVCLAVVKQQTSVSHGLTVSITGPGVNHSFTIPQSAIPYCRRYNTSNPRGASEHYYHTTHSIGTTLNLVKDVTYEVLIHANSAPTQSYWGQGGRDHRQWDEINTTAEMISPPPPAGWSKRGLHHGTGEAQRRVSSGGSWQWEPATWPGSFGQADFPVAFWRVGHGPA